MNNKLTSVLMKYFVKIKKSTPSHISYSILNILTIRVLKKEIKNERLKLAKYYHSFKSAQEIPPTDGNLRLVQIANAKFLSIFDNLCKENDIQYWLDWGTLLGAIRHKGFIPWDDDLDIAMIRNDYEKLITLFNKNAFSKYPDLYLEFENNNKNKCFIKIKNKKSENLAIDIFPYDCYFKQANKQEKNEISKVLQKLTKRKLFKNFKDNDMLRQHFMSLVKNKVIKNNVVDINKKPSIFIGIDFPHNIKNWVYDWDMLFPLKRISFEGYELLVPNDADSVLKNMFNNYMQIPKDAYPRHSNYVNIDLEEEKFLREFVNE